MSRLIGIVAIYLLMLLGWIAIGAFLVIAPARVGNLMNDSFGLFPRVGPHDWGKKSFLRIAGLGFLAFAIRFLMRILELASQE
jgi:hypothetical protein